ncbi:MAG: chitobiase/beta-hexosaminidase C-terminal domain-containing protein, partial [Prevotella sp.]|nr:chitobiase/beta-hexosaminidase C-terminal domain-containing protein [Prevotella sp.]
MKKLFTLACALLGMTSAVKAASVDDIAVCKHSYVLVMDEYTNNGTARPGKGNLFGDGFFLDVTGGTTATNKGKSNPSEMVTPEEGEPYYRYGEAFAKKYADVGEHYNCLRIKNAQDVIAMKVTAKSKLIFLMQGNNTTGKSARIPKIAEDAKLEKVLNDAPGEDHPKVDAGYMYEWTAPDDKTIYIGSYNGDAFIGILIVEANEAPGTPSVKVGAQTYADGLWFKEVTCTPRDMVEEGSTESIPTVVTYTTDGSAPTAASPVYTAPCNIYTS